MTFQWFDYSASMDAFAAGKLDANLMTNGDTLVTGSGGGKGIMIMATDYSNGNDTVIAKPGIKDIKALKGKKVGVEVGLVDHLLLLRCLQEARHEPEGRHAGQFKDQRDCRRCWPPARSMPSPAWQPIAGQAMKGVPGSRPVWTSKQSPGLIYDVLAVSPTKLAAQQGRLDQAHQGLGQGRQLHQRSQDPTRCAQDHVGARWADAGGIQAAARRHQAARPEGEHRVSSKRARG